MPVTVYSSTDASAPSLTSTAGSLISVLDACLVNGYGAKSAAGWVKSYSSSTTGASYRQGTGSNQLYVNVDDTQPNYARARGHEVMTAYNTGTGLFPTDAQQSGGVYFQKTNNVAGTRAWTCVANARIFYFFSQYDTTANFGNGSWFSFGDIISTKAGDAYNTVLIGAVGATMPTTIANSAANSLVPVYSFVSTVLAGHWIARSHTQAGASTAIGKHVDFARLGYTTNGSNLQSYQYTFGVGSDRVLYPNTPDGGLYVTPVWIHEAPSLTTGVVRGRLPGLYLFQGQTWLNHADTYTGSGDLSGKTFQAFSAWNSQFHIETSDTWY